MRAVGATLGAVTGAVLFIGAVFVAAYGLGVLAGVFLLGVRLVYR